MKNRLLILVLVVAATFLVTDVDAQCAMCKAVAESSQNTEEANSFGNGINKGIMYIMFLPYILLAILFGVFFRGRISGFLKQMGVLAK